MNKSPAQATFQSFKATLTRRVNRKDWCGVITLWGEFKAYYDNSDHPWPDDWRRWERAAEDARFSHSIERRKP